MGQKADLVALVKDYAQAITDYPADVRGQQRHFASVLPEKRRQLEDALVLEFGTAELGALGDVLVEILRERAEERVEILVRVSTEPYEDDESEVR